MCILICEDLVFFCEGFVCLFEDVGYMVVVVFFDIYGFDVVVVDMVFDFCIFDVCFLLMFIDEGICVVFCLWLIYFLFVIFVFL